MKAKRVGIQSKAHESKRWTTSFGNCDFNTTAEAIEWIVNAGFTVKPNGWSLRPEYDWRVRVGTDVKALWVNGKRVRLTKGAK